MPKEKSMHRFLISGEIHFLVKNPDGEFSAPASGKVNGILAVDHKDLGVRDIGRAQQILQMVHHNRMDNPEDTEIFDVFISSMSYLGFTTDEKFNAAPEGMKLQEKSTEVDPLAIFKKTSGTQH